MLFGRLEQLLYFSSSFLDFLGLNFGGIISLFLLLSRGGFFISVWLLVKTASIQVFVIYNRFWLSSGRKSPWVSQWWVSLHSSSHVVKHWLIMSSFFFFFLNVVHWSLDFLGWVLFFFRWCLDRNWLLDLFIWLIRVWRGLLFRG